MSDGSTRRVAGTVFSDGRPRLIQIKDINLDAEFAPHMLYVVNEDKPGFIGKSGHGAGRCQGQHRQLRTWPQRAGSDAIALVEVDGDIAEKVLADIHKLPLVKQAKALAF